MTGGGMPPNLTIFIKQIHTSYTSFFRKKCKLVSQELLTGIENNMNTSDPYKFFNIFTKSENTSKSPLNYLKYKIIHFNKENVIIPFGTKSTETYKTLTGEFTWYPKDYMALILTDDYTNCGKIHKNPFSFYAYKICKDGPCPRTLIEGYIDTDRYIDTDTDQSLHPSYKYFKEVCKFNSAVRYILFLLFFSRYFPIPYRDDLFPPWLEAKVTLPNNLKDVLLYKAPLIPWLNQKLKNFIFENEILSDLFNNIKNNFNILTNIIKYSVYLPPFSVRSIIKDENVTNEIVTNKPPMGFENFNFDSGNKRLYIDKNLEPNYLSNQSNKLYLNDTIPDLKNNFIHLHYPVRLSDSNEWIIHPSYETGCLPLPKPKYDSDWPLSEYDLNDNSPNLENNFIDLFYPAKWYPNKNLIIDPSYLCPPIGDDGNSRHDVEEQLHQEPLHQEPLHQEPLHQELEDHEGGACPFFSSQQGYHRCDTLLKENERFCSQHACPKPNCTHWKYPTDYQCKVCQAEAEEQAADGWM